MPLITATDSGRFILSNTYFTYVMQVNETGHLEHVYYGPPLRDTSNLNAHSPNIERGAETYFENTQLNLNTLAQEFPTLGQGDYREPAIITRLNDRALSLSLRFKSFNITDDKPRLKGLPAARGDGSQSLIITLTDAYSDVEIDLHYTIYESFGVLARSLRVYNYTDVDLTLEHLMSSNFDLPPDTYDMLHMCGSWAREMNLQRIAVPNGKFSIGSHRGTSSAAHVPFLAIVENHTTETFGKVYASSLVYSGNHIHAVDVGEFGDVRVQSGIHPYHFSWTLKPGESFSSPESLHVFTDKGLSSMSHIWHDFIRNRLSPKRHAATPRPSFLNTWEACYFDVTHDKILNLASAANSVGLDMIVLDDGWFKGRHDDSRALGDWTADPEKFPQGISALSQKIADMDLKFGLWLEPEMVSQDSDLYRAHPDWALHIDGRVASLGRNQLTLDLSRQDVVDHLFKIIDGLLSCGTISYVKWDMNRNMSDTGSAVTQDGQLMHAYMLGLYELLERVTSKYPEIIFENCASGGNRFDLGMLSFMDQTWTSDMCDPIGRLAILHGATHLFPLDCLAAYVGPSPNHQNGRISSLQARSDVGLLCAANGLSLNATDLASEHNTIKTLVKSWQEITAEKLGAEFHRLLHTDNETVWQLIRSDRRKFYIFYARKLNAPNLPLRRIYPRALDAASIYTCQTLEQSFAGDVLMHHGYLAPYMHPGQSDRSTVQTLPQDFYTQVYSFEQT